MAEGMHTVFFGLKRAYYATLGLTLRKMGLTAARFDMLYAIHQKGKYSSWQSELRRKLGVCASVVCRMLQALEAIGYVERSRIIRDKRQRRITLTSRGERAFYGPFGNSSGGVTRSWRCIRRWSRIIGTSNGERTLRSDGPGTSSIRFAGASAMVLC
jgi:DNA-binding MarR family transcriptional regulator